MSNEIISTLTSYFDSNNWQIIKSTDLFDELIPIDIYKSDVKLTAGTIIKYTHSMNYFYKTLEGFVKVKIRIDDINSFISNSYGVRPLQQMLIDKHKIYSSYTYNMRGGHYWCTIICWSLN